ncbi:MAG: hypothetical protein QW728_00255, partial [Thermoplasmata archaeon]
APASAHRELKKEEGMVPQAAGTGEAGQPQTGISVPFPPPPGAPEISVGSDISDKHRKVKEVAKEDKEKDKEDKKEIDKETERELPKEREKVEEKEYTSLKEMFTDLNIDGVLDVFFSQQLLENRQELIATLQTYDPGKDVTLQIEYVQNLISTAEDMIIPIKTEKQQGLKAKAYLELIATGEADIEPDEDDEFKEAVMCFLCRGTVKPGLPIRACVCGKKYHEACASRIDGCPLCGSLSIKNPATLYAERAKVLASTALAALKKKIEERAQHEIEICKMQLAVGKKLKDLERVFPDPDGRNLIKKLAADIATAQTAMYESEYDLSNLKKDAVYSRLEEIGKFVPKPAVKPQPKTPAERAERKPDERTEDKPESIKDRETVASAGGGTGGGRRKFEALLTERTAPKSSDTENTASATSDSAQVRHGAEMEIAPEGSGVQPKAVSEKQPSQQSSAIKAADGRVGTGSSARSSLEGLLAEKRVSDKIERAETKPLQPAASVRDVSSSSPPSAMEEERRGIEVKKEEKLKEKETGRASLSEKNTGSEKNRGVESSKSQEDIREKLLGLEKILDSLEGSASISKEKELLKKAIREAEKGNVMRAADIGKLIEMDINSILKKKASEVLRSIEYLLEDTKEIFASDSTVEKYGNEARREYDEGNYTRIYFIRDELEKYINSAMKDVAQKALTECNNLIPAARSAGLDVSLYLDTLEGAKDAMAAGDYRTVAEVTLRIVKSLGTNQKEEALRLIERNKALLEQARNMKIDTGWASEIWEESRRAYEEGRYFEAIDLNDQVFANLDDAMSTNLKNQMGKLEKAISDAEKRGVDAGEVRVKKDRAAQLLKKSDYGNTEKIIHEAKEMLELAKKKKAESEISSMKAFIESDSSGSDFTAAGELIKGAEESLSDGEVEEALDMLLQAKRHLNKARVASQRPVFKEYLRNLEELARLGIDIQTPKSRVDEALKKLDALDLEGALGELERAKEDTAEAKRVFVHQLINELEDIVEDRRHPDTSLLKEIEETVYTAKSTYLAGDLEGALTTLLNARARLS